MHEDIHSESNKKVLEIQTQNSTLFQLHYQSLHNRFTDMNHLPF